MFKLSILLLALIACFSLAFAQEVKILNTNIPAGSCQDKSIANGDRVSVLYVGKLEDGTVFDASEKHDNKPFTFVVGEGKVIPGWENGVMGMCLNEKREFLVPYQLAYGEAGIQNVIPEKANLVFTVDVVEIEKLSEIPLLYKLIPTRETIGALIIVIGFVYIGKYVLSAYPSPVDKKVPKTKSADKKKK
ncbi:FKBP-type peptidylprolyl cis-trans isomerase [Cavenderia fasciculata]|uniref:peptidylprolyl isomerase n=1 Tax=Cavenderia fasciculata TaxID=261658 RepID=F4Q8R1_CACFS|nr:FKBP-type peptidylprolyl cis-trans isomerase [Cavenderia fasciculata]EGG15080.1 FKBP-type peptidylprolyl cis-trans isomerase [Cavenderia fasciculata]|eukprot:XP_004351800.1 FKBP-type peptidylprolyl cis-trans isomerase [Cavenderia fasciculata]